MALISKTPPDRWRWPLHTNEKHQPEAKNVSSQPLSSGRATRASSIAGEETANESFRGDITNQKKVGTLTASSIEADEKLSPNGLVKESEPEDDEDNPEMTADELEEMAIIDEWDEPGAATLSMWNFKNGQMVVGYTKDGRKATRFVGDRRPDGSREELPELLDAVAAMLDADAGG